MHVLCMYNMIYYVTIYIYVDAYAHTHIIHCHNVILSGLIFAEAATSSCMVIPFRSFRQAAAFAAASRWNARNRLQVAEEEAPGRLKVWNLHNDDDLLRGGLPYLIYKQVYITLSFAVSQHKSSWCLWYPALAWSLPSHLRSPAACRISPKFSTCDKQQTCCHWYWVWRFCIASARAFFRPSTQKSLHWECLLWSAQSTKMCQWWQHGKYSTSHPRH